MTSKEIRDLSPAEINLHDNDFVNMRTALAANAACLFSGEKTLPIVAAN